MWLRNAGNPKDAQQNLWQALAWAARYGRQPLSELRQLTRKDLALFSDSLQSIVEQENTPVPGEDNG